jgi:hypothetical protein
MELLINRPDVLVLPLKNEYSFSVASQLTTFVGLNANADVPQSPGCRICEVTKQSRGGQRPRSYAQ